MENSERKNLEEWTNEDMGEAIRIHIHDYISSSTSTGDFLYSFPKKIRDEFWKGFHKSAEPVSAEK